MMSSCIAMVPVLHALPLIACVPSAPLRPTENSPPSPVFFKVKKTQEVSQPSQNGECAPKRSERRQQHSSQHQGTSFDTGDSESDGGSPAPPFPEEDPERMKHSKIATH